MTTTLLHFGATGATGAHLLQQALGAGLSVRAFVRTPSKIPQAVRDNPNLEVIQGDITDAEAVADAVQGASAVMCTVGDAKASKAGPIMETFVQHLVTAMRAHDVKRLTYQAGAFSPTPDHPNPLFLRAVFRPVLGTLMGLGGMFRDNDAVIAHLHTHATDLDWTVTRPGQLKDGASQGTLKAIDKVGGAVKFTDLAAFTLATVQSQDHVRKAPYLGY